MKKILVLVLVLALALPVCGAAEAAYTPGTYTAGAQGMLSTVEATVTVSESEITAVEIDSSGETAGLGTEVAVPLGEAILAAQSTQVDSIAGATVSSDAAKAAVQKCLDEAAGVEAPAASGYIPGTYTATVKGCRGEVTVETTFDEQSITDVKVTAHSETYGVGYGTSTAPIDALPGQIVEHQSLAVDSVSGATITSAAIKQAVAQCATEAGGSAEALQAAAVETAQAGDETYDVDVVVVGAGAAGLSAAQTALEAGANVLLVEKVGVTGGSTARSGGKILGAGTPWQTAQGFTDTPELMYEYLMSFDRDGIMDEDLVRTFCEASAENIQWLVDRGVQIQDVEPIHSSLTPWRVHNVVGGGGQTDGHGGQFTAPLTNLYEQSGGKVLYNCRANELLTDESGAVVGLKAEKADGTTVTVNAGAVILATGGYAHNEEMLAKYNDFLPTNVNSGVPKGNVGDGLTMAVAVGAKNFDAPGLQLVYVSYDCYCGINEESGLIVSEDGERVVDEWSYQSHVAQALADADSTCGYYITAVKDGVCVEPYPMLQWGVTMEQVPHAASIEELAGLIGMDAGTLSATVARYNELCAAGEDADFGKPAEYMIPVEGEMYYAFRMTPGSSVTFGGLQIDTGSHVLDENDEPIPGLYAAGEVAFTGLFDSEYPCCGMAIGSAVYYGRVAAENAVAGK
ncbi:MAG: FAD-dependent oxidoreductase [Clostridia bacterium]|nr:FAD-dependent oxidoreductase [Clostridia bacterium]